MATVVFGRSLKSATRGDERVEIRAERVQDLIAALCARYPDLTGKLDDMAVSIDDEVHNDALYQRLECDSVVHFLPRIAGG